MKKQSLIALGVSCCLASGMATADIRFNGFASIVAGKDTSDKPFSSSPYDDEISFKPESKFALQATADLMDGLSATAQIMARGSDDFDAVFEWAYLSYDINDTHTLRAGKMRIPFYKYSDYLDVGYAYPWVRPPQAMYSLLFSGYEGLSLVSNFSMGSWDFTSNAIYGKLEDTFFETTSPTEGSLDKLFGINFQFSKDWFSGHVAYVGTDVNIPHEGMIGLGNMVDAVLLGYANATGGTFVPLGDQIKIEDDYGDFLGLGVTIDYNNWLINSEWSKVFVEESLFVEDTQWYVSVAYRLDDFMPYVTFQRTEAERNTELASILPPVPVEPFGGLPLNAIVQGQFDSQISDYDAITIGIRYDFHPSAALKFEYNRYDDIVFIGTLGTRENPEDTGNFSIGVDLVF